MRIWKGYHELHEEGGVTEWDAGCLQSIRDRVQDCKNPIMKVCWCGVCVLWGCPRIYHMNTGQVLMIFL